MKVGALNAVKTDRPGNNGEWPDDRFIVQTICAYCGSDHTEHFVGGIEDWYFGAVPGTFAFLRCQSCRSLLLNRRIVPEFLELAYAGYYTHTSPGRGSRGFVQKAWRCVADGYGAARFGTPRSLFDLVWYAAVRLMPSRAKRLQLHFRDLPAGSKDVLDFGCGNGDFLRRARDLGHCVQGLDFDREAILHSQARGQIVWHPDDLEVANWHESFDHITANHVLEHLPAPTEQLRSFFHWLRPGGTIFIELPNAEAGGISRNGRFWRGFEAPRHFSLPSAEGLMKALVTAGFERIEFLPSDCLGQGMDVLARSIKAQEKTQDAGIPVGYDLTGPEFLAVTAKRPAQ